MSDGVPSSQKSDPAVTVVSEQKRSSESSLLSSITSVHLTRSRQTWTGAGSAAGFVLRYLTPMRRLMIDVCGGDADADKALAVLVGHLIKAGYSGRAEGKLRDFLIRGLRSSAKAHFEKRVKAHQKSPQTHPQPAPFDFEAARPESTPWLGYWRDCLLDRSWRSLERHQHAVRASVPGEKTTHIPNASQEDREDFVHDVLKVAMTHPGESARQWADRIASLSGQSLSAVDVEKQLEIARVRFAQQVADEVAQTLEKSHHEGVQAEIKTLGIQKVFAGLKVLA